VELKKTTAKVNDEKRLRYSVSRVAQGNNIFYTLTIPTDVLARTCAVTNRLEDPIKGFQRELNKKRALEIADYIDSGASVPNSIVLSAQPAAEVTIVGKGKTIEFNDSPGAFLILDGQHRVYGFSMAKTKMRVPVVIYNDLKRRDEARLFIDINTKQKPVPASLLLDIKRLAETEDETEAQLKDIFDIFDQSPKSSLKGLTSASDNKTGKISRVTFNGAVKPLLDAFSTRSTDEIFSILNAYIGAIQEELDGKVAREVITKAVVFKAFMIFFPTVAMRVQDRFGKYTIANFSSVIAPVFVKMPKAKLEKPGTSAKALAEYLEERFKRKISI